MYVNLTDKLKKTGGRPARLRKMPAYVSACAEVCSSCDAFKGMVRAVIVKCQHRQTPCQEVRLTTAHCPHPDGNQFKEVIRMEANRMKEHHDKEVDGSTKHLRAMFEE